MLQRTWLILWKEFIQIRRDPRLIGVVVALPIVMLLLYGFAFNLDVKNIQLAVYDEDRTQTSRNLIDAFLNSSYFSLTSYVDSEQALTTAIDSGKASAGLIIPARLTRELATGHTAQVDIIVDGSDSTVATTALGYATAIVQQYSSGITLAALQRQGLSGGSLLAMDERQRFWYNPELKSLYFLVPGLIAIILSTLSTLLTSVTVVRERERGTIELLVVSPVMPVELILGKLIPYVLIAFCDVILIMVVSVFLFHVPLRGSPWLVLLLALFFLMATLGIGILISATSHTQQLAQTFASMTTQLPTVFLSGFVFPITSMPLVIQWFTYIVPATHFIRILRMVFLKGVGWRLVWSSALFLLVMGVLMVCWSTMAFKKKL